MQTVKKASSLRTRARNLSLICCEYQAEHWERTIRDGIWSTRKHHSGCASKQVAQNLGIMSWVVRWEKKVFFPGLQRQQECQPRDTYSEGTSTHYFR